MDLRLVILDVWKPDHALAIIRREGCSIIAGATPFLQGLVEAAADTGPVPELRMFVCGGAGVPPTLIREAREIFPNALVWRAFGATEVPALTAPPQEHDDVFHASETDGRIWKADVRIVDPVTGAAVIDGEEGEILARSYNMSLGYLHDEDNLGAYDKEGYFRTGDLGRLVDDVYLIITGRKKDLIVRAGENISPKEIEDVLFQSDRIADVAIVSMPSRKTGEGICAFIVAAGEPHLTLQDIAVLMAGKGLAKQKTPEKLVFVPDLPRTASGKVRKDVLRAQAALLVEREGAELAQ